MTHLVRGLIALEVLRLQLECLLEPGRHDDRLDAGHRRHVLVACPERRGNDDLVALFMVTRNPL